MQTLKRIRPLNLAIYGLYLLVAVVMTWPLVTVMNTHFAGYPFGDAHEMTRHIWWIKTALQTGQPLIFQPLLGYPDGMQGVILWSDPLQFFPGWLFAFFMPLPAAYNLFALLTLALNGWAAYWLVWKLTGVRPAALLGGLAFMTAPVIQGHLAGGHGGLLVQWPLPLLVYHLLQVTGLYIRVASDQSSVVSQNPGRDRWRYGSLAVVFFLLTPLGHTLQLIYAVFPLIAVIGLTVIVRRDWWALLRLMLVSVVSAGLLLIFLLPVFSSTFGTSAYTGEGGGVDYSLDLLGIVTPSFNHPLFGQLDYTRRVLGVNIVEGSSYIGIIAGLLALLALWKVKAARWWLNLALVAWILALGPLLKIFDNPVSGIFGGYDTHFTLPYALLFNLPGFSLARTPGRFDFLVALVAAVLVGYGWSVVVSRQSPVISQNKKRFFTAGAVVVGLLIIFDYQFFWPLPTFDATIPQAVYDLAKREDVHAVFDVPWDNVLAAKDALWLQTAHDKPMIAGQVTRRTPVNPARLTILEQTLNPALLLEAGVDVVIVHKQYYNGDKLMTAARQKLGSPQYEDSRTALFNVPRDTSVPSLVETFAQPNTYTNQIDTYLYSQVSGWLPLHLSTSGNRRPLTLAVDGQVIARWPAFSPLSDIYLPVASAGYHVVTVEAQPTCSDRYPEGLYCAPPSLQIKADPAVQPVAMGGEILFANGLRLKLSPLLEYLPGQLKLTLWWQFDQPRTDQDIRFVKILDASGKSIAADDHTLGAQPKNSQSIDTVGLVLPSDLPAGDYQVYVGWYTYPELTRFKVLSDVPGAQDSWAQIGTLTVPKPP